MNRYLAPRRTNDHGVGKIEEIHEVAYAEWFKINKVLREGTPMA
jgi:hypothetical protein